MNDLLQKWKERISQKKFAIIQSVDDELYKNSLQAEKVLRGYFNPNDYTATINGFDDDNYLVHLLASDREQDIRLVIEMAELITYTTTKLKHIKLKSGREVIHRSLSENLFEGYIDKFLNEANITTISNKKYKKKDQNDNLVDKPVDNFFEFDGKEYLVECTRVNEPVNKSIWQLNISLIGSITKNKVPDYKAFKGYIGIKTSLDLAAVIDRAKEKMLEMYDSYINRYDQNENNSSIFIPKSIDKFESTEFDIEILPHYASNKKEEKLFNDDLYKTFFSFHIEVDHDDIRYGTLIIAGKNESIIKKINNKIVGKVKKKIEQHSEAPSTWNQLIFVEIDVTKGHSPNTPMFAPIERENIDRNTIAELTNSKISIVLIYKNATDKEIKREIDFLSYPEHKPVAEALGNGLIN